MARLRQSATAEVYASTENYEGQGSSGSTPLDQPADVSKEYAKFRHQREEIKKKDPDAVVPLPEEFRNLLISRVAEGSIIAANVMSLEHLDPVLPNGEHWIWESAQFEKIEPAGIRIRPQTRLLELLGLRHLAQIDPNLPQPRGLRARDFAEYDWPGEDGS